VTGNTSCDDLPTPNGWDTTYHGLWGDSFLAKYNTDGSLLWATYLGGSDEDECESVCVDPATGDAYVGGLTESHDFPTFPAMDPNRWYSDSMEYFVTKFSASGDLVWSTCISANTWNGPATSVMPGLCDLVFDPYTNSVYATGYTEETEFPRADRGWDPVFNGGWRCDAFLFRMSADGMLEWSTFLGAEDDDFGEGLAADGQGGIYVVGYTYSLNFPMVHAWDNRNDGDADGFVAKFQAGPKTLNVKSSPFAGVAVSGNPAGVTDYSSVLDDVSRVTLKAAAAAAQGYVFANWELNGAAKAAANPALAFYINGDSTAVAKYKPFKSLRITGPTTIREWHSARYVCTLRYGDGTSCVATKYARWTDNSRYAKFTRPGYLRTYGVTRDQRCRVSATYAGRTRSVWVTIRNAR